MSKLTKNRIYLDIDLNRNPQLKIEKGKGTKYIIDDENNNFDELLSLDIQTLCEGILALIRFAKDYDVLKEHELFTDVINHLNEGFVDPEYETHYTLEDDSKKD